MESPLTVEADLERYPSWHPPPFCRMSWVNEASRSLWEPRLNAARDALEDLTVLLALNDGYPRLLFARAASRDRLRDLAVRLRVKISSLPPRELGRHDVAAGRAARHALCIGGRHGEFPPPSGAAACEEDDATDPIWWLAKATADAVPFDEGYGFRLNGNWASNPLLAAIGLSVAREWPKDFDDAEAEIGGVSLMDTAERHGRGAAIGYLRETLSWPSSWTCLHGVAEVKTPMFRFVRNAPPTAQRRTVHFIGTVTPGSAPCGLGFPFIGPVRGGRGMA